MSRLDELLDRRVDRGWHPIAWIVVLLMAALIVWSYFAELDEVAVAEGEVVPRDKVKVVQHLEGGIIKDIHVQEGKWVSQGDPLVQIELAVTGLNRQELAVRFDGLILNRARLAAEVEGAKLELPEAEAARRPDLATAEAQAFVARRNEHNSRLSALRKRIRQQELAIKELQANKRMLEIDLSLAREALAISEKLVRSGLTSKVEHLERRRQVKRNEGELAALEPAIPRARAALAEARERHSEERSKYRREALEQLGRVELEIARTREILAAATGQELRTVIRSPIDGIVKNLRYHTIGGVVGAGEPIMEIVPSHADLVIEARLSPADRGYVSVGQRARAKITTYDFVRYGSLDGDIVHIAADSTAVEGSSPFFQVVMQPDRNYLGATPDELPISPGMMATVDITTGSRSVLQFVLKPVLRLQHEAFRER